MTDDTNILAIAEYILQRHGQRAPIILAARIKAGECEGDYGTAVLWRNVAESVGTLLGQRH